MGRETARHAWPPPKARLKRLIDEATVDAHDDSEQRVGFFTMIEDNLALPFDAEILGVTVTVERVDFDEAEEIVAVCRRGRAKQRVSILNLPLPVPAPDGAEWIEAYRHWACRR